MSARSVLAMQFPVYQIDFSAVAAGKRVAATKRRIRWRFGFPNLKAIEEGRTGTDCRGEEHEIVIIWSVTSGKRQIIMDGREIHFSSNRVGLIDYSWNTKGNHVLKTICHAAPPMSASPGFRQYDLFIDGQSFFRMPKVYELGVKGISANENRIPGQYASYGQNVSSPRSAYEGGGGDGYGGNTETRVRAPRTASEEDAELQRAIKASLEEAKHHLGEGAQRQQSAPDVLSGAATASTEDLLDFDSPSVYSAPAIMPDPSMNSFTGAPQPLADAGSVYGSPPPQQQYLALPPTQPAYGSPVPSSPYGAPPPQQQYGASPPQPQYSAPPAQQYGAPPQPQYGALPASQPVYGSPPPQQQQQQWPALQQEQYAPQPSYGSSPTADPYAGHRLDDPFAPKPPSHRDVANDILKAYGGVGTPTSAANGMGFGGSPQSQGYYQPGQLSGGYYDQQPQTNGNSPNLSMNGLVLTASEEEPQNPFEATLKKLVNIDHIDQPAEEKLKLTMKQQEDERAKKNRNKSVPLPPAAARVVGSGATLKEIATVKPPAKKEIVMTPLGFQGDPAMAGALVIYGQGPPPLQPRGYGVVHMQGQYAAQPPQPQQQRYGNGYR